MVRQKLYRASELLQSLRSLYTQLVSVQSSDGDRWSLTMEEVARAKVGVASVNAGMAMDEVVCGGR